MTDQTLPAWWPVDVVIFLGDPGLDYDAFELTVKRLIPGQARVRNLSSPESLSTVKRAGCLVVVPNSARHADAVTAARSAARLGFQALVLGLPPADADRVLLTRDKVPFADRDQIAVLAAALSRGELPFLRQPTDNAGALEPNSDLTARETQLLELLGPTPDLTRKQVAQTLGISEETAKVHLASLRRKLGVTGSGRGALARAVAEHHHRDRRESALSRR